ncbi:phospholipase D family protein, partial [bacterium]
VGRAALACLWLLVALTGCASLPERPVLNDERARAAGTDAALDRMIAPEEARHPEQSAFRLVSDGTEAFVQRMLTVRLATRSLDIQTYIWHADLTGMYFAQELLRAADRGVRVRLLLDDVDARSKNDAIAALAAHNRIEVRIFNPFATRHGFLSFLGEGLLRFQRINRRMHNKSWIADNRYAVVGGRNVGNEYFGAGAELNFVDLDFAMIGPVVRQTSDVFDRYWNSASAYPIETLDAAAVNREALDQLRATLDEAIAAAPPGLYQEALATNANRASLIDGEWDLQWASRWRFVADDPAKVRLSRREARSRPAEDVIGPMMSGATEQLDIISPYFVPSGGQADSLVKLATGGKT